MADILMYHGIDEAAAPTSISPATFAMQMSALAESERPVISLSAWLCDPQQDAVVITFDDALSCFADVAWPILRQHGFPAIVYVPTGRVGGSEDWDRGYSPARPILPWSTLRQLAQDGVQFGGHSRTHCDLTRVDPETLAGEIIPVKTELEDGLGQSCDHFAPPYGATTPRVRAMIAAHWSSSVGTTLNYSSETSDTYNLPRIEMLYFGDPTRWRAHLAGRGHGYFAMRRGLRSLRKQMGV